MPASKTVTPTSVEAIQVLPYFPPVMMYTLPDGTKGSAENLADLGYQITGSGASATFTAPPKTFVWQNKELDQYDVDYVASQLAGQRKNLDTDKYWQGGGRTGFGDISALDQQMAADLVARGITDIEQIGEKVDLPPKVNRYTTDNSVDALNRGEGLLQTLQSQTGQDYVRMASTGQLNPYQQTITGPDNKQYLLSMYNVGGDPDREDPGRTVYGLLPVTKTEQIQPAGTKTIINKVTGQPLYDPSKYSQQHELATGEPKDDGSYIYSGTYAGAGNTAYHIKFTDEGLPIFYTSGHSSSDFDVGGLLQFAGMAAMLVPGIGTAVGGAVLGGLGVTGASAAITGLVGNIIIQTALTGGNIENAIKNAGASYLGAEVAGAIGSAASDLVSSPAGMDLVKSVAAAGTRAAVLGQNVENAVASAVLGKALNLVTSKLPDFEGADAKTKSIIMNSVQTIMSGQGDITTKLNNALTNGALTLGLSKVDGFNEMTPAQQLLATSALQAGLQGRDINDAVLKAAINSAQQAVRTSASTLAKTDTTNDKLDAEIGKAYQDAGVGSISDAISQGKPATEVVKQVVDNTSPDIADAINTVVAPVIDASTIDTAPLVGVDLSGVDIPTGRGIRGAAEEPSDFSGPMQPGAIRPTEAFGPTGELDVGEVKADEQVAEEVQPMPGSTGQPISIQGEDGSVSNFDAAGNLISFVDPDGVVHSRDELYGWQDAVEAPQPEDQGAESPLDQTGATQGASEADQIFAAAEDLRRKFDEDRAREAANTQTIDLQDGSSVTIDNKGEVVAVTDPDGQVTDLRPNAVTTGEDTTKGVTGVDTLVGETGVDTLVGATGEDAAKVGEGIDTIQGAVGVDTLEGGTGVDTATGATGVDTVKGGEEAVAVEEEPERIAREAREAYERELADLANKVEGDASVDTVDSGAVEAQPVDGEKVARDLGFPNEYVYNLYGGDIARFQQDEAEYNGFPDWNTYLQYAGDVQAYRNDVAVAEGWPDADTKDQFGTFERYAQHLQDEADLEARGQKWEKDQTALRAGFPDYETYEKYGGDVSQYLLDLAANAAGEATQAATQSDFLTDIVQPTDAKTRSIFSNESATPAEPTIDVNEAPKTETVVSQEATPAETANESVSETETTQESPEEAKSRGITVSPPLEETQIPPDVEVVPEDETGPDIEVGPGLDVEPGADVGPDIEIGPGAEEGPEIEGPPDIQVTPKDLDELDPLNLLEIVKTETETGSLELGTETELDTINLSMILETETETATETATSTAVSTTPVVVQPTTVQPTTAKPTTAQPTTQKPFTPLPPGLTADQILALLSQMGQTGPFELPYYFQMPEESSETEFDITKAFSPTLYKLSKE